MLFSLGPGTGRLRLFEHYEQREGYYSGAGEKHIFGSVPNDQKVTMKIDVIEIITTRTIWTMMGLVEMLIHNMLLDILSFIFSMHEKDTPEREITQCVFLSDFKGFRMSQVADPQCKSH